MSLSAVLREWGDPREWGVYKKRIEEDLKTSPSSCPNCGSILISSGGADSYWYCPECQKGRK
jgi:tRNA(Ile2) C34 agmatinyltransferase TiaS